MYSVYLSPNDSLRSVQSYRKDSNSYQDVLNLESTVDPTALCSQVIKPGARGLLFYFSLQFGQSYKKLSRGIYNEESNRVASHISAREEAKREKKTVFEVNGVLLQYI